MLCDSLETKEKRIALIPGTSGLSSIFYRYITLSLFPYVYLSLLILSHSLTFPFTTTITRPSNRGTHTRIPLERVRESQYYCPTRKGPTFLSASQPRTRRTIGREYYPSSRFREA
jgi:hypothetical protein